MFLGREEKAKSATTADTAKSADIATEAETARVADSVLWSSVSEKPESFYPINYAGAISVASNVYTYTCTKSGLMFAFYSDMYEDTSESNITVNGKIIGFLKRSGTSDNPIISFLVKKNDVVRKNSATELRLFPIAE